MRKQFITVMLLFICCIVTACRDHESSAESVDSVVPRLDYVLSKPDGNDFKVYKTIEDAETTRTITDMFRDTQWSIAKVDMSRMPDYKIQAIDAIPEVNLVREKYDLWLSPQGDYFEVVIEGFSKYGKLTPEDSMVLLAILTTP